MNYFALKLSNPELRETVEEIKHKQENIEINQLNQKKEDLKMESLVFVQLGGDIVPWDKGLIGLAKIVKAPYDEGYDKSNPRNFKIQISMCVVLDEVIKREDFRYYYDAYDAGGIGPNTKGEQNQAIKMLTEKQAAAILRVVIERFSNITLEIRALFDKDFNDKIFGVMTRLVEKDIDYNGYLRMQKRNSDGLHYLYSGNIDTMGCEEIENLFWLYLQKSGKYANYCQALKSSDVIMALKRLIGFKYDSVFSVRNLFELEKLSKEIEDIEDEEFKAISYVEHLTLRNALIKYICFLLSFIPKTIIYYGVPGVGKSYRIKKVEDLFEQEKTVFHPEYTNADFVGQLLPVRNKNEDNISNNVDNKQSNISYEFVPGPFTRILAKALKNKHDPDKKYMLVIDEINRGNAAAIFGEIFQLLDRDESGKSEFGISNKDIYDYLIEKEGVDKSLLPDEKIYLPSNLYIWATMNTSDQNVYTLDTAFQRRWQMEMLTIDFDKDDDTKAQGEILIPNSNKKLTWREFVTAINEEISNKNAGMISMEDKRIGPWFARKNEIEDSKLFSQKVIRYLWDDAFKMSRTEVFKEVKTLDEIVDKINKGINIEDIFDEKLFEKVINDKQKNKENDKDYNAENEILDANE